MISCLSVVACAERAQPAGAATADGTRLTQDAVIAADGYRLPLRRWLPEPGVPIRAVVVALHGFNDYSVEFEAAGRYFAGRGVAMYAYDQRGFGATHDPGVWAGDETLVNDARAVVRLTAAAHPRAKVFLLGCSMGGAVTIRATTGAGAAPVAGAILSAPAVWGFQTMKFVPRNALRLVHAVAPGLHLKPPPELNIRATDNLEAMKAIAADPLVIKGARVDALYGLTLLMGSALDALPQLTLPTLAMYGAHEEVLPPEATARAQELIAANPKATIKLYPDGWHMLLRDRQAMRVVEDIAQWIDARLGE